MKRFLLFGIAITSFASFGNGEDLLRGKLGTIFEVARDPRAPSQLQTVEGTLWALASRGWPVHELRVRLAKDPFDATLPGADVILPLSMSPEDNAFLLVHGVVKKALGPGELTEAVASLVAAHMAPPSSGLRHAWEARWQELLLAGELQHTALLEVLWRRGGDQVIRSLTSWEEAWKAIANAELHQDWEESLWNVIAAGLLTPAKLGFTVGPVRWPAMDPVGDAAFFRLKTPQLRWVVPSGEGNGVGLLPNRLVRGSVRVFVIYDDGRFDVVPATPIQEVQVSRMGVKKLMVAVMSQPGEALVSLTLRPLHDYPVLLGGVEFSQDEGRWQLAWDVEQQSDVAAYVVEIWRRSPQGEALQARELIPTLESGPARHFWTREGLETSSQVRLFALTNFGLLARLFVTPVVNPEPLGDSLDQAP